LEAEWQCNPESAKVSEELIRKSFVGIVNHPKFAVPKR
jgi:hypothetical protein